MSDSASQSAGASPTGASSSGASPTGGMRSGGGGERQVLSAFPPLDIPAIIRELAFTTLIASALVFPLLTLRTVDSVEGLYIESRWMVSFMAVALVVAGRLGLILLRYGKMIYAAVGGVVAIFAAFFLPVPSLFEVILVAGGAILALRALVDLFLVVRQISPSARAEFRDRGGVWVRRVLPWAAGLAVVFAIVLPFMPFSSRYLIDVGVLILTYVLLGWGLNIIVGYAGLLDLGYVAFYAVGAYSYALLAYYFDFSFWICLPLAGLLSASFGLLLGFPVLRLRGDYFAIVTLGFGEIIRLILINWFRFTNGPDGISSIPRPSFFGIAEFARKPKSDLPSFHETFGLAFSSEHRLIFLYYLVLVLAALVAAFTLRVRNLPLGRAWEALREDDVASASLGISRTSIKLAAFGISATWGGIAGSFFATRQGFISPESFTFIESAIILSIVVLGGMGSLTGIACAAVLLIGLPEVFRELVEYRMVTFGGGLVLIMIWRPRGLLSFREPSIRLLDRRGRLRFAVAGRGVGESLRAGATGGATSGATSGATGDTTSGATGDTTSGATSEATSGTTGGVGR